MTKIKIRKPQQVKSNLMKETTKPAETPFKINTKRKTPLSMWALITPSMAAEMLEAGFEGQRNIIPSVVSDYANKMRNDQWVKSPQGVAFATTGRCIDGQHRLSAIVESGIAQYCFVTFGLDENAFKAIDNYPKTTDAQLLKSICPTVTIDGQEIDLKPSVASKICSVARYMLHGGKTRRFDAYSLADYAKENIELIFDFLKAVQIGECPTPPSVTAAFCNAVLSNYNVPEIYEEVLKMADMFSDEKYRPPYGDNIHAMKKRVRKLLQETVEDGRSKDHQKIYLSCVNVLTRTLAGGDVERIITGATKDFTYTHEEEARRECVRNGIVPGTEDFSARNVLNSAGSEPFATLEVIRPELAQDMLSKQRPHTGRLYRRKINQKTVEELAEAMKKGEFRFTHHGIAFDTQGYLFDGRATLSAIVRSGKTVRLFVRRGLDPEVALFVDGGETRKAAAILQCLMSSEGNKIRTGQSKRDVAIATAMLGGTRLKSVKQHTSEQQIAEYAFEHLNLIEDMYEVVGKIPRNDSTQTYTITGVIAAFARAALYYNLPQELIMEAAERFREAVSRGTNDPLMKARRIILQRKREAEERKVRNGNSVQPDEFYRLMIGALKVEFGGAELELAGVPVRDDFGEEAGTTQEEVTACQA